MSCSPRVRTCGHAYQLRGGWTERCEGEREGYWSLGRLKSSSLVASLIVTAIASEGEIVVGSMMIFVVVSRHIVVLLLFGAPFCSIVGRKMCFARRVMGQIILCFELCDLSADNVLI